MNILVFYEIYPLLGYLMKIWVSVIVVHSYLTYNDSNIPSELGNIFWYIKDRHLEPNLSYFFEERYYLIRNLLGFLLLDIMMAIENNNFNIRNKFFHIISLKVHLCKTIKCNIFVSNNKLWWNCYFWPLPWCFKLPGPANQLIWLETI